MEELFELRLGQPLRLRQKELLVAAQETASVLLKEDLEGVKHTTATTGGVGGFRAVLAVSMSRLID